VGHQLPDVDPALSEKRRRAGRRGATSRWGIRNSKPHFKTARPIAKLRQGRNDWYKIENRAAADTAEVFIYDEIGFFGITAADFVDDLRGITAGTIELHLNTPGGDAWDGVAIYNALRDHAATVNVVVDSVALSAGSFIAQAGDLVTMNRGSQMMIHDAWGLAIGNAADMSAMADLLDKQSGIIAAIYADRAGGSVDVWREAMRAESWYDADEAVEAGLADEVAGRDATNTENSFDLTVFSYAGRDKAPAPAIEQPPAKPAADDDIDFGEITKSLKEALV
jgi:ATP-dependent protease ClpP protease subunit